MAESQREPQRLSKIMSQRGLCSRREADRLISLGQVLVNGQPVDTLGIKVDVNVDIELSREAQQQQQKLVTIMLHKPVGYVSAQAEKTYQPAIRLITSSNQFVTNKQQKLRPAHLKGLAPAGRLDIESQGLLLMTQDGRVAKQIIGETEIMEKEYLVRINAKATAEQIDSLKHGMTLDGKKLKPARVEQLNSEQLRMVLTEGKKRQIRRMCESLGLRVDGLKRVRIGGLRLGKLPVGKWQFVSSNSIFSD